MENQDNQSQINYNQQPSPQPISNANESKNPAMHFFLYLVSFLSLCSFSTGVGAILFQIINKNISDTSALEYDYIGYFYQGAVKYGIASLIIATPVYLALAYLINKYLYEGKISEDSKIRKWLTYIILFLTAGTILGDLISLVYNMLSGDIVARFILKTVVVLAIAGSIFFYYLIDIKKKNMVGSINSTNKILAGIVILVALGSIVMGFTIIDSPFASRDKKIDQQTVSNLRMIENQISDYYKENSMLPSSLDDLKKNDYYFNKTITKLIIYKKVGVTSYKLCADFKRASTDYKTDESGYPYNENDNEWTYSKGNYCFDRNVDKIITNKLRQSN